MLQHFINSHEHMNLLNYTASVIFVSLMLSLLVADLPLGFKNKVLSWLVPVSCCCCCVVV